MKRILMISFQFPPYTGSSGVQRTLRFAQYLPSVGWQPLVLTAIPSAYRHVGTDLLADIPPQMIVSRAFALDTARHLAIFGRHAAFLARPDSCTSWRFDAVRRGMSLIARYSPSAIWSTYPTPTAHLVAARLCERSGLPWIADFRDPMTEEGYPGNPKVWRSYRAIEMLTLRQATRSVFTTPGTAQLYRERYRDEAARIAVVENGYDEGTFEDIERHPSIGQPLNPGALTLLHSGVVYPSERDPRALFAALGKLKADGVVDGRSLRIRFRAPVHADLLHQLKVKHSVEDMIEILPSINYRDALCEMVRADALVVMQASNCNRQIPAKVYEYLRAGRPIVALTERVGDTAAVLAAAGISDVASLASEMEITDMLTRFVRNRDFRAALRPTKSAAEHASRRARTGELAHLLEGATTELALGSAATAGN